ncbi:hypothetical protein DD576_27425, partial [Klebsiella pneumoniae]|uniref:hypothetical protein n=1 Tax=Klebsiella pneumoniae TaxID=573 RepID=UPI0010265C2D
GSERKKWQKALIISELRHEHALRDLLRAAGMSRSTWYYNMSAVHYYGAIKTTSWRRRSLNTFPLTLVLSHFLF